MSNFKIITYIANYSGGKTKTVSDNTILLTDKAKTIGGKTKTVSDNIILLSGMTKTQNDTNKVNHTAEPAHIASTFLFCTSSSSNIKVNRGKIKKSLQSPLLPSQKFSATFKGTQLPAPNSTFVLRAGDVRTLDFCGNFRPQHKSANSYASF